jgi:hypothetical protein
MLLHDAKTKALAESAEHACAQHVNFKITGLNADDTVNGYFYVSDWYDSDCTVFSYSNGAERY